MTTLTQYQATMTAKGYDAVNATFVTTAINAARREIVAQRPWTFLELENTSLVTVVGNPLVSIAAVTNFAHPDSVRLSFGTEDYPIDFLDPQAFKDGQQGSRYSSIPSYWTFYGGGLMFDPRPDKAYTISFDYLTLAVDLVAGSDVCIIPAIHQDVVGWAAAKHLAYRQRKTQDLAMADSQYQAGLTRMIHADKRVQRQSYTRITTVDNC